MLPLAECIGVPFGRKLAGQNSNISPKQFIAIIGQRVLGKLSWNEIRVIHQESKRLRIVDLDSMLTINCNQIALNIYNLRNAETAAHISSLASFLSDIPRIH
ncbi:hypothetical protein AVEN_115512-1 [Araneus ventricosus]|uniref:Uncharacterized protein n=1 Tax=Araneus ventricosus TaxID=182803 RepID=A0A4Y2CK59_ARAVE|nr:hypothetical protein AVEN_115512-1 [Araneus ventricosus]